MTVLESKFHALVVLLVAVTHLNVLAAEPLPRGVSRATLAVESNDPPPRGVSISQGSFYQPGKTFSCLDGSQTIPYEQINDDYCDCTDGSDEPGTSACRNGRFYCLNRGYKPETIPSSRVSDGVCDCCDGSDEYEGKANCQDTCIEMGKSMREELIAMRKLIEEGHRIRADYSVQGKQAKTDKQIELQTLGPKRDALEKAKEELLAKKTAAEEPEKAAKEVHEAAWKEELAIKQAERDQVKATEAFNDIDTNKDQIVTLEEFEARMEFDSDKDGTVTAGEVTEHTKYEDDTADLAQFIEKVWPEIKSVYSAPGQEPAEPLPPPPTEEVPSAPGLTVDNDDDDDSDFEEDNFEEGDGEEDDDESGDLPPPNPEDDNLMPAYPDATLQLMKLADEARALYTDAEKEYDNANRQIEDIEKFLAQDMGPDDVFYPLRDQCYEYTDREYTYKFCPFEKSSQRPKAGGSETSLGTFTKWEANEDETYGFMKFEKGVHCWNGPDRSATVKFICGKENTLTNGAEPNRCEYTFDFTTPAACHTLPEADPDMDLHEHPTHSEL